MSKFKREDDENERLQKQVRELKVINRSLTKKLTKLSKGYYKFLSQEEEEDKEAALEKVTQEVKKTCWDCGGNYNKHTILNRTYRLCDRCGKKGKTKINGS